MKRAFWTRLVYSLRRTALPLAAYYAVTLALPLANGAGRSGVVFVRHALIVLVVPLIVIGVACAVSSAWHYGASRRWNDFGRVSDS
jgi:hypothetical protein